MSNYLVSNGAVNEVTFTLPPAPAPSTLYSGWECDCGGPGGSPDSGVHHRHGAGRYIKRSDLCSSRYPSYFGFYAAGGSCLQTVEVSVTGGPWTLTAGAFGIASRADVQPRHDDHRHDTGPGGTPPANQQAALAQACAERHGRRGSALGDGGYDSESTSINPGR